MGPPEPRTPWRISAPVDGLVTDMAGERISRPARTAGAPRDKGAGVRIFKKTGDRVDKGERLYRIFACDQAEFDLAAAAADANSGYLIDGAPAQSSIGMA